MSIHAKEVILYLLNKIHEKLFSELFKQSDYLFTFKKTLNDFVAYSSIS